MADTGRTSSVQLVVRDSQGMPLGEWQVDVPDRGNVAVDVTYGRTSAAGDESSGDNEVEGCVDMAAASSASVMIMPRVQECHIHMWQIGVMTDAHVVARYGVSGLDAFRSRTSDSIDEGEVEGSEVTTEGEGENGEDVTLAADAVDSELDIHANAH